MRVCTFCGHSKIYSPYEDIKAATQQIVSGLIQDGYDCFLVGNYGQFDRLAASVCLTLKRGYPSIGVNLVVPYYQPQLDSYEKEYHARFDDVGTRWLWYGRASIADSCISSCRASNTGSLRLRADRLCRLVGPAGVRPPARLDGSGGHSDHLPERLGGCLAESTVGRVHWFSPACAT